MARPKQEREANRDAIIRARLTEAEKRDLLAKAAEAGMTPSDFIRSRTIGSQPQLRKATPDRTLFIKALGELGKVGSNLNQIARALNIARKEGRPLDVSPRVIQTALQDAANLTNRLLKALDFHDGHSR